MALVLSGVESDDPGHVPDTHKSLREVLAWATAQPKEHFHPRIVAEVITQDEFTHDVIVPYKDLFLVYDTT